MYEPSGENQQCAPEQHARRWLSDVIRTVTAVSFAALVLASCGLVPQPGAATTFEPGVEHLPAPGLLSITGDPKNAARDLTIEYMDASGEVFDRGERVRAGGLIQARIWSNPGGYRVVVNGEACDGSVEIVGDKVTAVTLHYDGAECRAEVVQTKPSTDD
jgi:hypothetical protein